MKNNVVTRFAPSPTGFMHIGGVRTALFAYLLARKHNGTFILRIEDTDKEREVEGSIAHIQESLAWLGLDWDYGPDKPGPWGSAIQSERLSTYMPFITQLIEAGHAYPDPYTKEEVEAFRERSKLAGKPFLFRDYRPENPGKWEPGKPLRLKVPEVKRYEWEDAVRGTLSAGEEALDDFILLKTDGFPTYNFAHVIDDHSMGVTHIMRTDEFISSTPKFLSLYDALGFTRPIIATLPPILRDDRTKKLGKRDGAKDILEYRTEGYLPEAMINFLALIGWNPGTDQEKFSKEELISSFSLDRIQRAGGAFNEEKLDWLNKQYIQDLSPEKQLEKLAEYVPERFRHVDQSKLVTTLVGRISTLGEAKELLESGEFDFLISKPNPSIELLLGKNKEDSLQISEYLAKTREILSEMHAEDFGDQSVKDALWDFATEIGRGTVLWPLRVALSGAEKSPDPFILASLLGKEETIERITHAETILTKK